MKSLAEVVDEWMAKNGGDFPILELPPVENVVNGDYDVDLFISYSEIAFLDAQEIINIIKEARKRADESGLYMDEYVRAIDAINALEDGGTHAEDID